MNNINEIPLDLPSPIDDGGVKHLKNLEIPQIQLPSTQGEQENVCEAFQGLTVLFIYPRARSPIEPNKNPELWNTIPGARGCTPQSCGFRDLYQEFKALGVNVFGMSIQSPKVHEEFVKRNHIPFPILSDHMYEFTNSLNLPTFNFEGERLIKRMALFIKNGNIQKVFYPVFPPNENALEVLSWLKTRKNSGFNSSTK